MAFATRYSSLSALVATVLVPIGAALARLAGVGGAYTDGRLVAVFALLALLIVIKHRANIARLVGGTEPKIGANT